MWNGIIIPVLLITAFFLSHLPKCISFSSHSVNISALAKVLTVTTGMFPLWSLNKFFNFLNRNILFLECSKKDYTYISDFLTLLGYVLGIKIKNKFENEDDLDLFLNSPNFMRNGIIILIQLIKAIFFCKLLTSKSFSSRSMNKRALAEVLILTTEIFRPLALRNNYSLNATNFRRL